MLVLAVAVSVTIGLLATLWNPERGGRALDITVALAALLIFIMVVLQ